MSRPRALLVAGLALLAGIIQADERGRPVVTIEGESFLIDGVPTYQGVTWRGQSIEGLLLNSRMVQGIFDDENPGTRALWRYPDADDYDAERNTREFVDAMPLWREHGLLAFTLCLQGGGPIYTRPHPYHEYINSAYDPAGELKPEYMTRLEAILERAAELDMAVILGLAYFGIDHRYLESPDAIRHMADGVVDWLAERDCRHVLIEIANEATVIRSRTGTVSTLELMERIRARSREKYPDGFALLCSTSLGGGKLHDDAHMGAMDFILVHGNGCDAARHLEMIRQIRAHPAFEANPRPIVFNEAHTDVNCLRVCAENRVSWGYYDQGRNDYANGYQTPPVNWGINSDEKRRFFELVRAITSGSEPEPVASTVEFTGFTGLPATGPVGDRIAVQVSFRDPSVVARVEFLVDGERVNVERVAPYYLGGDAGGKANGYDTTGLPAGEHALLARVVSVRGETMEVEIAFTVGPRQ